MICKNMLLLSHSTLGCRRSFLLHQQLQIPLLLTLLPRRGPTSSCSCSLNILRSKESTKNRGAPKTMNCGELKKEESHVPEEKACEGTDVSIDKSKLDVSYDLLALRVPKQHSGHVSKLLSGYVFNMPRVRHIVPDPSDPNIRLVILSQKVTDPSLSQVPGDKLTSLRSLIEVEVVPHQVVLGYDYWPADHILKVLLPDGSEVPSSFETVGHIAHLNIRDEMIPFKKLIAAVILEKNKQITTILNKVGTITNEYRVPTFEVLAGEENLVTEVKQHGALFQLDYGLVYWNSRLEQEHIRLVSQFKANEVICDMFAGIGPFAIPAAQKGCIVYANDLNPTSVKYLEINARINKVSNKIHVYNMDAREFMLKIMMVPDDELPSKTSEIGSKDQECLTEQTFSEPADESKQTKRTLENTLSQPCEAKPWKHVDHIVMNLPASALNFLDVFYGLLSRTKWNGAMPRVHCYCFMRARETIQDIIKRAEDALNGKIRNPDVWEVRDVAPNKAMLCLSFDLPEDVGFGQVSRISSAEVGIKRARLDGEIISTQQNPKP